VSTAFVPSFEFAEVCSDPFAISVFVSFLPIHPNQPLCRSSPFVDSLFRCWGGGFGVDSGAFLLSVLSCILLGASCVSLDVSACTEPFLFGLTLSDVAWILDVIASIGRDLVEPVLPKVIASETERVEGRRGVVRSLKMDAVSAAVSFELSRATCVLAAAFPPLRDQDWYHDSLESAVVEGFSVCDCDGVSGGSGTCSGLGVSDCDSLVFCRLRGRVGAMVSVKRVA
jgi:hypothetical protein